MQTARFRRTIWSYYRTHGRHGLPWRKTRDPYRILISEVMLQQTQVQRVLPKYEEFVRTFPDFRSLAQAPFSKVFQVWQGLGYNRRALGLKRLAEIIVHERGGKLPRSTDELVKLPALGKATAASVAAFAWNAPTVFIETNIRTVFTHFFFPGKKKVDDAAILQLVQKTLDTAHSREWYYALMDHGVMLKKEGGSINARNKRYRPQGRFTGSERERRGRIMKLLVQGSRTKKDILSEVDKGGTALAALEKEGLIKRARGKYRLA